MVLIQLDITVRVPNHRAPDAYTLKIFASSPDDSPTSVDHKEAFATGSHSFQCEFDWDAWPGFVHLWLFRDSQHPDLGIPVSEHIGGARLYSALLQTQVRQTAMLYDPAAPDADVQAVVEVTLREPVRLPTPSTTEDELEAQFVDVYNAEHAEILGFYNGLRSKGYQPPSPDRSNYYYVRTNMGEMPITVFAFLASLAQPKEGQTVEMLLEHMLAVIEADNIATTDEQRLVELCTLLPRNLLYMDDTTRTAGGGSRDVDRWTMLCASPTGISHCAFDCEDGAGLVMAVVCALRRGEFKAGSSLQRIQALAKQYTPCFTLGNLRVHGGWDASRDYVSHAYVTLLDSEYVEAVAVQQQAPKPSGEYRTAIILESTNYVTGIWNRREEQLSAAFGELQQSVRAAFQSDPKLRTACRMLTPFAASNAQFNGRHHGSYEDVYVLMAVDHREHRVLHCIATTDSAAGLPSCIGTLAESLAAYSPRVKLHCRQNLSRAEFKAKYNMLWKEEPCNRLPGAPAGKQQQLKRADTRNVIGVLDVPSPVWWGCQERFTPVLAKLGLEQQQPERELAEGISCVRLLFRTIPLGQSA